MSPRRLALVILVFVGVLAITEAILGNIVASLLQDQLEDYAWLIVVPFIVIAAVLLGFGLRERVQALLQDRRPALDRRNRQAVLDKLRANYTYRLQRSLVHEVLIAQVLRSLSKPLQSWKPNRATMATEVALECVDGEVPVMAFSLQHTKGDQTARQMMQLSPLRARLTAIQPELILAHTDHLFDWCALPIEAADFRGR